MVETAVPVAVPFKAWFCGRSLGGVVGLNPAEAWTSVYCEWCVCVLSESGLCDGPIPRPEESYRVCACH